MHRVKQNKEGKQKQEVVAAEGKPNEEKCFKLTGGQEGSRGVGEVPRQQQRWFERGAANTDTKLSEFPAFPWVWVPSSKLGLLTCSGGTQAGLMPPLPHPGRPAPILRGILPFS